MDVNSPAAALYDIVDSSNRRAPAASESSRGLKSKGAAVPFHPMTGGTASAISPVTASSATPPGADSHLYPLHTSASTPHPVMLTGAAPAIWVTSTTVRAPALRAAAASSATSIWLPVAY